MALRALSRFDSIHPFHSWPLRIVVLRVAHGGGEDVVMRRDPRRMRAPTVIRGRRGRREEGKALDTHLLQFTVYKQLSLPIRLSFMFSFGLFLVA